MSVKTLKFDIVKDYTIHDVEDDLAFLKDEIRTVNIKLPRHHKMTLFKDSWISSLISNSSKDRTLIIKDWITDNDQKQINKRFSNSLIGVTSAFLANEISNVRNEKYDINIHEIIEHIVFDQDGVIEDNESGKSFVFCSFDSENDDSNYPRPYALSASSKEEFIKKLLLFKRERIDTRMMGIGLLPFPYEEEWDLPNLIFELYQNTLEHGRYNAINKIIKGVRSFSIKKHLFINTKDIITQADKFEELLKYIDGVGLRKNLKFYEISISDNGMGIIDRLITTRPEILNSEGFVKMSGAEKLNYIIAKTLSSKQYPGSGLGLTTALRNLSKLGGFLSLRTGDQWVYFDGKTGAESHELKPINNSKPLAKIRGTHYNILIPAS